MTFCCLECGRKFKTVKAAEKAANNGCPGCGGVDIDIDIDLQPMTGLHISGCGTISIDRKKLDSYND